MSNFFDLMISKITKPFLMVINEDEILSMVIEGIEELDALFHTDDFIDSKEIQDYLAKYRDLNYTLQKKLNSLTFKLHKKKNEQYNNFITSYFQITEKMHEHNELIASQRVNLFNHTLNPVEGRILDHQQVKCIVKESHNHLVLAGAGTGKTTTIVGLVKYLLYRGINQEDILVLSYTNASATEMMERIKRECKCDMDISTFHKLGLNIIIAVEEKRPLISKLNLQKFVANQLNELIKDKEYFNQLVNYMANYNVDFNTEFDFQTKQEYEEYLEIHPPITLKRETVKSHGERMIANFLFQNGIKYEYESKYKIDTRDHNYSQYYPDFYLPDYDLYIEYYAIDRNGQVPAYFNQQQGHSYQDAIIWKQNLHRINHTRLIECFAYEQLEGLLLQSLGLKLVRAGVVFNPISSYDLWNIITNNEKKELNEISRMISTIITLIKNNNCSFEELMNRNNVYRDIRGNQLALEIVHPIYEAYEKYLKDHNEIDFNDMINLASTYVQNNQYQHHYQYVIIDEYQDISQSRFHLVKSLRDQKDFKLFCVGDDWQSIYRFNGSDIGFILDFEKYWGITEISKIENTYRFSQQLCDMSSKFIMNNDDQVKKNLKSSIQYNKNAISILNTTSNQVTDKVIEVFNKAPRDEEILLLGRYNFDIDILRNHHLFECKYDANQNIVKVIYKNRKDLNIKFQTIHASKGLQANYVIILNNKRF